MSGGCSCHGATFCPDLIGVGYENDVPVFVRRDSAEGREAVARELETQTVKRKRAAATELYAALERIIEHEDDCVSEGAPTRLTNGEYDAGKAAIDQARSA